jgi:hypothetical protein
MTLGNDYCHIMSFPKVFIGNHFCFLPFAVIPLYGGVADTKYLTGWSLLLFRYSSLPLQFVVVVTVHPSLPESVTGNPRLQLTVAVVISFAK